VNRLPMSQPAWQLRSKSSTGSSAGSIDASDEIADEERARPWACAPRAYGCC
jgi:hypothetical protein